MTLTVKHGFTSGIADDPTAAAAGEVLPSHWNANHTITGTIDPSIGGRTILAANTNYYVATTGNDSNPGSLASPWATLQHAMNFIGGQIDIAGFTITVNIGAGSFAGLGSKATVGGGIIFWSGAGSGSTTITNGPNDGVFNAGECLSIYVLQAALFLHNGITFKPSGANYALDAFAPCTVYLAPNSSTPADIKFDLTVASDNGGALIWWNYPSAQLLDTGYTIIGPSVGGLTSFLLLESNSFYVSNAGSISVTNALSFSTGFIAIHSGAFFSTFTASITGASVTGPRFQLFDNGIAGSPTGAGTMGSTYFPGNAAGTVDVSSIYDGFTGHLEAAGLPTTTQFPDPGVGGLYKDTSGGGVYMVYNDAGTIKKVQLT